MIKQKDVWNSISAVPPDDYCKRFQNFVKNRVLNSDNGYIDKKQKSNYTKF